MITLKEIRKIQAENGNAVKRTSSTFNGNPIYQVVKKDSGRLITSGTKSDLWVFCGLGW